MPIPSPTHSRTKILATFDGHGAYVRAWNDHYFLCASELNEHLDPGTTWDDPAAQVRAALRVIAQVEADPGVVGGSFRFPEVDEYRRHRRRLSKMLKLARHIAHWPTTMQAMAAR